MLAIIRKFPPLMLLKYSPTTYYSGISFSTFSQTNAEEYYTGSTGISCTREPDPGIPGTMRQKFKNRKTSCCCPCQDDSIGMPTLHIGPAVSEKTGREVKGFSFIVMGNIFCS